MNSKLNEYDTELTKCNIDFGMTLHNGQVVYIPGANQNGYY